MEGYRRLIRAHVYDKCWQLDITWAEVEQLLDAGDVVEETENEGQIKRVRFLEGSDASTSHRRGRRRGPRAHRVPDAL